MESWRPFFLLHYMSDLTSSWWWISFANLDWQVMEQQDKMPWSAHLQWLINSTKYTPVCVCVRVCEGGWMCAHTPLCVVCLWAQTKDLCDSGVSLWIWDMLVYTRPDHPRPAQREAVSRAEQRRGKEPSAPTLPAVTPRWTFNVSLALADGNIGANQVLLKVPLEYWLKEC